MSLYLNLPENPKQHYLSTLTCFFQLVISQGFGPWLYKCLQGHIFSTKKSDKIKIFHSETHPCFAVYITGILWGILENLPPDTKAQGSKNVTESITQQSYDLCAPNGDSTPSWILLFCLVQVKPEIPHETNHIQNSSTPRIMGRFGAFSSQVWTSTQISMKIWLFLNLHGLSLPCCILNPVGRQNLSNPFLQGPQCQGGLLEKDMRTFQSSVYWIRHQMIRVANDHWPMRKDQEKDTVPQVDVNPTKALLHG